MGELAFSWNNIKELVIPSSVGISKMIENTYEMNTQLTIEEVEPENNQEYVGEEENNSQEQVTENKEEMKEMDPFITNI